MIKSIEINYPQFNWLHISQEFTPWINVVEQPNWYGKTTMMHTIASFFTWKFPWSRTLPEWYANLEFGNWTKGMLSKSKWIGASSTKDDLIDYIIPWKFFDLNTPEQRLIITKLLWLDIHLHIHSKLNYYYIWIESDLKKQIKDTLAKETVILDDIMRYEKHLMDFKAKDFKQVEDYLALVDLVDAKTSEHNLSLSWDNKHQQIELSIINLNNQINSLLNKEEELLSQLESLKDSSVCNHCKQEIDITMKASMTVSINEAIDNIAKQLSSLEDSMKVLQNELSVTPKPEYLNPFDVELNASKFLIQLPKVPQELINEYYSYKESLKEIETITKELDIKKALLKSSNTVALQNQLDEIKQAKVEFTEYLQKILKSLPLEIELFKTKADWELTETFNIKKDWIDYADLSTGNKTIVQIMLSLMIINKLWLDFIMIDEAAHISKSNLDYIKELSNTYQVIMFKPTWWSIQDFK